MKQLVLNPQTREQVEAFTAHPSHAMMLVGPVGSGKHTLATAIAETLLGLPEDSLASHPYVMVVAPEDGKAIGIEAARQLEQFLALKVPGTSEYDRIVIIEDAHLLTTEAQNALLKTLEEPPEGTILIMTVGHEQALLPTIRSRAQTIPVGRLQKSELDAHFSENSGQQHIDQAYAISGGLPGLMDALLSEADHPLVLATQKARELLSSSPYERLTMVDELAKQKALAFDVTVILQQMARLSLQTAAGQAARKWQRVLSSGYEAGEALLANGQPKLVLTKLALSL